jgi:hypothetical protein
MPQRSNPDKMTADAIIAEIRQLSASMDDSARRVFELSEALHRYARKTQDHDMSTYIAYANAYKRVSNMVGLGLRRTSSMDRRVTQEDKTRKQDQQEREELEEQERAEQVRQARLKRLQPENDPLVEVYGDLLNA